jgi:hypothetical protein
MPHIATNYFALSIIVPITPARIIPAVQISAKSIMAPLKSVFPLTNNYICIRIGSAIDSKCTTRPCKQKCGGWVYFFTRHEITTFLPPCASASENPAPIFGNPARKSRNPAPNLENPARPFSQILVEFSPFSEELRFVHPRDRVPLLHSTLHNTNTCVLPIRLPEWAVCQIEDAGLITAHELRSGSDFLLHFLHRVQHDKWLSVVRRRMHPRKLILDFNLPNMFHSDGSCSGSNSEDKSGRSFRR